MATLTGASISITTSDDQLLRNLQELAEAPDTTPLMYRMGEYFQGSTQQRFTTQTDPQGLAWKPLSPGYIKRKKKNTSLILTLNAYLRRYILAQVLAADTVAWGSNRVYAAIHNAGGNGSGINGNMPQRQFLGVSDEDNAEVLAIVQDWLHRKMNGLPD